eukprot:SAG31_NODE_20865_length_564_cov_0.460215_1_plen_78_part_00
MPGGGGGGGGSGVAAPGMSVPGPPPMLASALALLNDPAGFAAAVAPLAPLVLGHFVVPLYFGGPGPPWAALTVGSLR